MRNPEEWLVLLFCVTFFGVFSFLRLATRCGYESAEHLMNYGRLIKRPIDVDDPSSSSRVHSSLLGSYSEIRNWLLPKSWFLHFYVYASWFNIIMLFYSIRFRNYEVSKILWTLMEIHFLRRWEECLRVSKSGREARMHVFHYVFGLGFYTCVCIAVTCCGSFPIHWFTSIILILMFVIASYLQRSCHRILANLRPDSSYDYVLPKEGWFLYLACPHYFFEILIYLSMVLIQAGQSITLNFLLAVTICNLTITARKVSSWYRSQFIRDSNRIITTHFRYAIIPFVV
jgi:3-oxo-5-alpha-steroid 4-dehydrogenase 3 / polyprenol reductase